MPSEYEIRAEALRNAVRVAGELDDALHVAERFATWLRKGVEPTDPIPSIRCLDFETHGECGQGHDHDPDPQDVGHPGAPAPFCPCGHDEYSHRGGNGCLVGCTSETCAGAPGADGCTLCGHEHVHTCWFETPAGTCECKGAPAPERAPNECTCVHGPLTHSSWSGCTRTGCGCVWDGKVHP